MPKTFNLILGVPIMHESTTNGGIQQLPRSDITTTMIGNDTYKTVIKYNTGRTLSCSDDQWIDIKYPIELKFFIPINNIDSVTRYKNDKLHGNSIVYRPGTNIRAVLFKYDNGVLLYDIHYYPDGSFGAANYPMIDDDYVIISPVRGTIASNGAH